MRIYYKLKFQNKLQKLQKSNTPFGENTVIVINGPKLV